MKGQWISVWFKPEVGVYVLVKTQNNEKAIARWNGLVWILKTVSNDGLSIIKNVKSWMDLPE